MKADFEPMVILNHGIHTPIENSDTKSAQARGQSYERRVDWF